MQWPGVEGVSYESVLLESLLLRDVNRFNVISLKVMKHRLMVAKVQM